MNWQIFNNIFAYLWFYFIVQSCGVSSIVERFFNTIIIAKLGYLSDWFWLYLPHIMKRMLTAMRFVTVIEKNILYFNVRWNIFRFKKVFMKSERILSVSLFLLQYIWWFLKYTHFVRIWKLCVMSAHYIYRCWRTL